MINPRCAVCGHISRVGADACELCDTRFDSHAAAGGADPSGAPAEPAGARGGAAREGALPTDIPAPRFLGVADVVSPTLQVYRKNFVLVGQLVLATTLPLALLQCVAYVLINSDEWADRVSAPGAGPYALTAGAVGGVVYWLLTLFGNAVLTGALAYAVVGLQRTGAARAAECLRWGLTKMFKLIGVGLLSALIIYVGPGIAMILMGLVLGQLAFVGFLMMLLPWIVLILTFSLVAPAVAVENQGLFGAFRRSAELTKGFKGLLFLTYFLWWVAISALGLILTWSFTYGGEAGSLAGLVAQTLVGGMLNSSMTVLTLYIFLGILNERRHASGADAYATAG
ncbi:MAG TPA: hypothetical protein VF591_07370 [Pyrinomonadaceae bacterium]|jgi:hypothetical protein